MNELKSSRALMTSAVNSGRSVSVAQGDERAGITRRVMAEIINRLLPLPFIAWVFPAWTLVVVAYHLFCDAGPSGKSPGKSLFRLRVISAETLEPCGQMGSHLGRMLRGGLRRLGIALSQAIYCHGTYWLAALAYDLASLAFVWVNAMGRRPEDYLAHTVVVSEGTYRRLRRKCNGCGEPVLAKSRYCPFCGASEE